MQSVTTFKLFFGDEDIRRVTLQVPDYDNFMRELVELYPTQFHPELRVCYKDEEGDLITISTQKEWDLMLASEQGNVKKLYISEGKNSGKYFKDGPPPAPLEIYTVAEGEKKAVEEDENIKKLEFTVPKCLERLLPGGKVTPFNLPSWMEGCVEVKRLPGEDLVVDLDIDICTLFESLHRQALALIKPDSDPQLLKRAKDFLQSMLDIVPNHPLANYNLACAESLLGEAKEAVESLKRAVAGGYENLSHMLEDTDLINVRSLPEFQELVESMRQKLSPQPKEEKKEEKKEEVKEEAKEEVKEEKKEEVKEVKEEKKEEVKEEEKKEVPEEKTPSRWAAQLESLRSMGFCNTDVNEVLLDDHKGDVVKVVNALLFGQ